MRVLVSTTTHMADGRLVDSWDGDYIEAESHSDAIAKEAEWEAKLLKENGASDVEVDGDTVYYTIDGEEMYKEVQASVCGYYIVDCITGVRDEDGAIESLEEAKALRDRMNAERKASGASDEFWMIIDENGKEYE